ncbi:MAG: DUF4845 domain-containing protein [Sideroxydans sp.]|nr:DUF4845 domain-containing protein [Sideroxydans sp.]
MKAMQKQQHGLTMSGFLVTAIILIFAAVFAMKLIPAYMQDGEIKHVFEAVAQDPAMQGASIREIQLAYAKRASVQGIDAVKLDDVDIAKDSGGISLSASYQVKIPLVANISLVLDFNPSSSSN